MRKLLPMTAAVALAVGVTAGGASAQTIYTNLAAFAGPSETGFPTAAHCGTSGCQFSVVNAAGTPVWFGTTTVPPPPPATVQAQIAWASQHAVEAGFVGLAVANHKQLSFQLITGGTVPCEVAVCGSATAQQVENIEIFE